MEVWYNLYLPLWIRGTMTIEQLQLAVTRERITQEKYDKIIATPQNT
ncbi:hypothetical protein SDC9_62054 [bioreactor metagenome]|uniref:XkdX family protein n=1 Tax=bioreactor metagenome TaxID=1076179 RepID=A0A644XN47_9ZZZZ